MKSILVIGLLFVSRLYSLVVVRDKPLRKGNKTMTRKDYEKIALAIKLESLSIAKSDSDTDTAVASMDTLASIVQRLGETFAKENPRFDFDKFVTACGFTAYRPPINWL